MKKVRMIIAKSIWVFMAAILLLSSVDAFSARQAAGTLLSDELQMHNDDLVLEEGELSFAPEGVQPSSEEGELSFAPSGVVPFVEEDELSFAPEGVLPSASPTLEEAELSSAPRGVLPAIEQDELTFAPRGVLPVVEQGELTFAPRGVLPFVEETEQAIAPEGVLPSAVEDSVTSFAPEGVLPSAVEDSVTSLAPRNALPSADTTFDSGAVSVLSTRVTISYRSNGHTGGSVPTGHTHNTPASVTLRQPGNMVRSGHVFGGWRDWTGNVYPAGFTWTVTGNATYTFDAVWLPNTVTISYRGNGNSSGTVPASHTHSVPATVTLRQPGTMARSGHTFGGWRDSHGNIYPAGFSWTVTSRAAFIFDAVWIPNTVTISYRGNGHTSGSVPTSHTHNIPATVTLRQPGNMARSGHVFGGWRDWTGTVYPAGFSWTVTGSTTFIFDAVWIPNTVTVSYGGNGHTSGTVPTSHTHSTPATATLRSPGTMARTGHSFGGWRDSNGNVFPAGFSWTVTGSGTITFAAVWIRDTVTITYRGNGHTSGTVPASHAHNTPATATLRQPGTMARTGHSFGGWRDASGNVYPAGFSWTVTGNGTITFDAVWVRDIVTITYKGNGHTSGIVPASHTIMTPATATLRQPGTMARTGHSFGGWRDASGNVYPAGFSWTATGSGTITFDAVWIRDTVTITYRGNGHTSGTVPASHAHNTPATATLRQPGTMARTGHSFGGWRDASGNVYPAGFSWTVTGNTTFIFDAVWIPNIVTITYRGNGHTSGVVPASHTIHTPATATLRQPGTMTRSGHIFGGWRDERGNVFSAGHSWTLNGYGNIVFDAVWISSAITVTYNGNGHTSGAVPASHSHTAPTTVVLAQPGTMTRVGHTFAGWRASNGHVYHAGYNWLQSIGGTFTFDAVWVATTTFTVSPNTWNPIPEASNITVNVTTNTTWSTPTSDATWLTISNIVPANRTGNGNFRINASANTTGAQRIGSVSVTAGGITRSITVVQGNSTAINLNARIFHDSTAVQHNTQTSMRTISYDAVNLYRELLNVNISINTNVSLRSELDAVLQAGCSHNVECNNTICGRNCRTDHCKAGSRKIGLLTHATTYTINIVGYSICAVDTVHYYPLEVHRAVGGLGQRPGRNTIVSSNYAPDTATLQWIIQHEIGHNFGARDDYVGRPCTPGQLCTMRRRTEVDELCTTCWADMQTHLLTRYT